MDFVTFNPLITNNSSCTTIDMYESERGEETCVTTDGCSGKTIEKNWEGLVALMYPLDYGYSYVNSENDSCYKSPDFQGCNSYKAINGWIYNSNTLEGKTSNSYWFISHGSNGNDTVFAVQSGTIAGGNCANFNFDVFPVVYLSDDVKIFIVFH